MGDEYGANFVTITDEDGNDLELEHLDTLEYNGQMYMAFFPAETDEGERSDVPGEEDESGLIILKVIQENGEELLSTLESEEELEAVYEKFMEELFEDEGDGE